MAAYRWVYDSRTGISSGTLCSAVEYGLPLPFVHELRVFVAGVGVAGNVGLRGWTGPRGFVGQPGSP